MPRPVCVLAYGFTVGVPNVVFVIPLLVDVVVVGWVCDVTVGVVVFVPRGEPLDELDVLDEPPLPPLDVLDEVLDEVPVVPVFLPAPPTLPPRPIKASSFFFEFVILNL